MPPQSKVTTNPSVALAGIESFTAAISATSNYGCVHAVPNIVVPLCLSLKKHTRTHTTYPGWKLEEEQFFVGLRQVFTRRRHKVLWDLHLILTWLPYVCVLVFRYHARRARSPAGLLGEKWEECMCCVCVLCVIFVVCVCVCVLCVWVCACVLCCVCVRVKHVCVRLFVLSSTHNKHATRTTAHSTTRLIHTH